MDLETTGRAYGETTCKDVTGMSNQMDEIYKSLKWRLQNRTCRRKCNREVERSLMRGRDAKVKKDWGALKNETPRGTPAAELPHIRL